MLLSWVWAVTQAGLQDSSGLVWLVWCALHTKPAAAVLFACICRLKQTTLSTVAFLNTSSICWANWTAPVVYCTSLHTCSKFSKFSKLGTHQAAIHVCSYIMGYLVSCTHFVQDLGPTYGLLLIRTVSPSLDQLLSHSASGDQTGDLNVTVFSSGFLPVHALIVASAFCPAGTPLWSRWPAGIPGSLVYRIHSPAGSRSSENAEIRCQQNSQVSASAMLTIWEGKQILSKQQFHIG